MQHRLVDLVCCQSELLLPQLIRRRPRRNTEHDRCFARSRAPQVEPGGKEIFVQFVVTAGNACSHGGLLVEVAKAATAERACRAHHAPQAPTRRATRGWA